MLEKHGIEGTEEFVSEQLREHEDEFSRETHVFVPQSDYERPASCFMKTTGRAMIRSDYRPVPRRFRGFRMFMGWTFFRPLFADQGTERRSHEKLISTLSQGPDSSAFRSFSSLRC